MDKSKLFSVVISNIPNCWWSLTSCTMKTVYTF